MTRVKRSVHARKKRRETLERAKGYRGEAHSSYRRAKEALMKADAYAYRDRRHSTSSGTICSSASSPRRCQVVHRALT